MMIYREETFGPIAPVIVFDDEDEVIAAANDTTYGLASYIYTRDLRQALRSPKRSTSASSASTTSTRPRPRCRSGG